MAPDAVSHAHPEPSFPQGPGKGELQHLPFCTSPPAAFLDLAQLHVVNQAITFSLEETQCSLSQRLQKLEVHQTVFAPTGDSTVGKDQDMGVAPRNRGRARSSGPERQRCQHPGSALPVNPLGVPLKSIKENLNSSATSARVFMRAKFDNKFQVACETIDAARDPIQGFIQTPRIVGNARIYATAFDSFMDAKYNFGFAKQSVTSSQLQGHLGGGLPCFLAHTLSSPQEVAEHNEKVNNMIQACGVCASASVMTRARAF
eukprot:189157-Amphidinium_carterae.1